MGLVLSPKISLKLGRVKFCEIDGCIIVLLKWWLFIRGIGGELNLNIFEAKSFVFLSSGEWKTEQNTICNVTTESNPVSFQNLYFILQSYIKDNGNAHRYHFFLNNRYLSQIQN